MARDRTEEQRRTDFAVNLALRSMIRLALALPYRWRVPLVGWLTRRLAAPLAGYRARARANLRLIWPDMPEPERNRIADEACDNAGRTLIENYSSRELMARVADLPVHGAGMAALAAAQAEGRPVLLLSGHFGNYEAARAALVARGFRIGAFYRPLRNAFFNRHYVKTLAAYGAPVFPQGAGGTAGLVRHLRSGGQMVLLFDLNVVDGEMIDFLGRPAATATSAAELARRYGAEVIPFYAVRQPDGLSFQIELEAPIPHGDPLTMTRALNESLAARVRANPGQWFWIHRRWK
jgi:KDO2-lipid IV(A) lauroyltransferase